MPAQRTFKVVTVTATIAVAALGLSAWWVSSQTSELVHATSVAQTAQAALAQEQVRSQQVAAELSQSAQQAQEQTSALQASIEDSQRHQQEQMRLANRTRELSKGLAAASGVKVAMAEHYMTMVNWPASNHEIGMPPPDSYENGALQSIAVEAGGKIRLVFAEAGIKEHIWLHGSVSPAGHVNWQCTSPDIIEVAQLVAGCVHRASP